MTESAELYKFNEALLEVSVIANIGHICFLYRTILRKANSQLQLKEVKK